MVKRSLITALRRRPLSRISAMAGLAALLVSIMAIEGVIGRGAAGITSRRMIVGLVGVALLLIGLLLSAAPRWFKRENLPWLAAIYITFSGLVLQSVLPDAQVLEAASGILLAYVAAICLFLPRQVGVSGFIAILGLNALFWWANRLKIALLGLPVTVLDIKIALANPTGLWDALGAPHWTRYLTLAVVGAVVLFGAGHALHAAYRFVASQQIRYEGYRLLGGVVAACLITLLTQSYLESLYARISIDEDTWEPAGVSKLYEKLGVLPFLAYSRHIEMAATGDFYRRQAAVQAPSSAEVRDAVLQYVDFASHPDASNRSYPNIVMLLAESTFDVGKTFRLQGEVNDKLFTPNQYTSATGPLFVNTVGGGTWITEFETIVGLDSRAFGYSGYYTHSSLSPFVERSLATYLRERGYLTSAFLPHEGNFYNARRAYENYGFETIFDSADLGREKGWRQTDVEVIEDYLRIMGSMPQAPFFSYILSIENHPPHKCDVATTGEFKVHFRDTEEFEPNCALHEYLRRLDSTTAAVGLLLRYLADLTERTGRPFVLVIFGDHQPHTFTSTAGVQYDFSSFRQIADKNLTFFHILSTVPGGLKSSSVPPPATLLPTLVSSFVANRPEDVYLGVNLWLYAHCGSDAIGREFPGGFNGMNSTAIVERSAECKSAYDRALVAYQDAHIFRLSFNP